MKTIALAVITMLVLAVGYLLVAQLVGGGQSLNEAIDPTPQQMTLVGTYLCLPHLDTTGPQTEECAFGIQADDGTFYAVNFGASANAMQQFQSNARVRAEGFFVPKEALSTNQWQKYDMKGIFTVTQILGEEPQQPQGKIDINAVCDGVLAYMSFTDGEAAATFVAECKEGKHPEVIDQWKKQMGFDTELQVI